MTGILNTWRQRLNAYGRQRTPFLCYVDFELQKPVVLPLHHINNTRLLFDFAGFSNAPALQLPQHDTTHFTKQPMAFEAFNERFTRVMHHLHYGNSFLVNLTFPTPIQTNIGLKEMFYKARQPYKLWVENAFTVFSPEKFVQITDDYIHSFPMKGTIDASLKNAEMRVLESKKEQAEHATITDLIRNDLSQVATQVKVVNYRYIEKIHTNQKDLLQVSSHIKGYVGAGWQHRIGDILTRLLPAGSVSGAPKPKTLEIIRQAEVDTRGYYTGIMGIFNGNTFDSAVMIRFVEQKNGTLLFRSGGGVTAQSNAYDEYHEMVDKVYFPWRTESNKKAPGV